MTNPIRALVLAVSLVSLASAQEATETAPPVVAPAPPARPTVASRPAPIDLTLVGRRWQVMQDSDGRFYRVRLVSSGLPAMWAPGLAVWLGSYLVGGFAALPASDGSQSLAWLPFVGPVVNAVIAPSAAGTVLWTLDAGAQIAGCIIFVVGLEAGPLKLQRRPIVAGPVAFVGGGSGLAVSGRF